MKYSLKNLNILLEKNNFSFKKMFGQNFIIDSNIIDQIIKKSEIDKDTLVIEIGPGAGALTTKLAEVAGNVLCYEIDHSLEKILNQILEEKDNVKIIFQDFLKSDIKKDIDEYKYSKIYVIANLPYYITTPIITKIIDEKVDVDKMVVMVQKEVGNRFYAEPGTKSYNSLTIFLNYYFNIRKLMDVSRNVFLPKPNVDSIIVEFTQRKEKYKIKDLDLFFKLVRDSFKQKRKTLKNNLKDYDLKLIEQILLKHSMSLNTRAETIPIEIFVEIANILID